MPYKDGKRKYTTEKIAARKRVGQPCAHCKQNPRPHHSSWCGPCRAQYAVEWRLTKPTFWRNYLRKTYEITPGEYQTFFEQQDGVCGICGAPPKTRRLNTDHSHRSGAIRGLLCPRCNRGLPWFKDNPALLESAARYLRSSLS